MSEVEIRIYKNDNGNAVAECEIGNHCFEIECDKDTEWSAMYHGTNEKDFTDFELESERNEEIASKLMELLYEL